MKEIGSLKERLALAEKKIADLQKEIKLTRERLGNEISCLREQLSLQQAEGGVDFILPHFSSLFEVCDAYVLPNECNTCFFLDSASQSGGEFYQTSYCKN